MVFKKKTGSNKELGNRVEKEFAQYMYAKGWWVHIFSYNSNGQPCDIVMSKDNLVWFLDVKSVQTEEFDFSRIEPNQMTAFELLVSRGTINAGFACKFNDGWYLLDFSRMKKFKMAGLNSLSRHSMIKI
jgi:Holliday junction resolvase